MSDEVALIFMLIQFVVVMMAALMLYQWDILSRFRRRLDALETENESRVIEMAGRWGFDKGIRNLDHGVLELVKVVVRHTLLDKAVGSTYQMYAEKLLSPKAGMQKILLDRETRFRGACSRLSKHHRIDPKMLETFVRRHQA